MSIFEVDEPTLEIIKPDEKTIEIITRVFSPKIIKFNEENFITIETETENSEKCAIFCIYSNSIYIDRLYKCGITKGTELLQMFDELAKQMPNIKYINLRDGSSIEICENPIILYIIKILTTGQSWYNSKGYFSENHESDKSHNERIRNMNCEEFIDMVYTEEIKNFKRNNTIENNIKKVNILSKEYSNEENRGNRYEIEKEFYKYKNIVKNYNTLIGTIISEHIKEQEADKLIGSDLFPYENKTVTEYFNYIWSDIDRNIKEKGCGDIETIKKCKWLSNFIEKIFIHKLLKYTKQLKKYFPQIEPVSSVKQVSKKKCFSPNCSILGGYKKNKSKKNKYKKTKKYKKNTKKNKKQGNNHFRFFY